MKTKMILIALAVLVVGIAAWKLFGGRQKPSDPKPSNPQTDDCSRVLSLGSRGEAVKTLQQYLNTQPIAPLQPLAVDGLFGPATEAALMMVAQQNTISLQALKLC
jgi:peptidoglycan hydrolase-like protein with peptidoglycan-binding domain